MTKKILIRIIFFIIALIVLSLILILVPETKKEIKPDPANTQCAFFCETEQRIGFCFFEITVNENLRTNCNELATNSQYSQYNVQPCPSISCQLTSQEQDKTCVTGLNSTWVTPNIEGNCPEQENKFARKRSSSDNSTIEGQICCYYGEIL